MYHTPFWICIANISRICRILAIDLTVEVVAMFRNKKERFVELAEMRVNKALHSIRLIGNLANRRNYEYTDQQASQIISALDGAVKDIKALFREGGLSSNSTFKLKK